MIREKHAENFERDMRASAASFMKQQRRLIRAASDA
jgi:hypothetical protein